jgi:hypothetical protein
MKLGFDPKQFLLQVKRAFNPILHHHVIIAFVAVVGVLIAAVFTVNSILTQPSDQAYITQQETEGVKTKFDEITMLRIDILSRSNERKVLALPTGRRSSPFIE